MYEWSEVMVMTFTNERSEFLFCDSTKDDRTYYTLIDRNGDILRAEEIKVKLEAFITVIQKSGYKKVKNLVC